MAILAASKGKPAWLDETRAFCRDNGITIAAWGPDLLTVEAKSPERAKDISSRLAQLGFRVVKNEEDSNAGLLSLSRNPEAIRDAIGSFNISRRPLGERLVPLVFAALSAWVFILAFHAPRNRALNLLLAIAGAVGFAWYMFTAWTWRLEFLPEGIHIRRYGRWVTIPWKQILAINSQSAGRARVAVTLKLESHPLEKLGTFVDAFGINLRDRLRYELAQRRHESS